MQGIILKFSTHILKVLVERRESQIFYLSLRFNFMLKNGLLFGNYSLLFTFYFLKTQLSKISKF